MRSQPIVAAIGEVLWDVYPDLARFGGAPANFACHATALGADAPLVSAVGKDELGDQALQTLKSHNVDTSCIDRDATHPTGQVRVTVDAAGRPTYVIADDSAWDNIQWSDSLVTLARQADAVCFGTLAQRSSKSRETIRRFVGATLPGTLRMFDVNLRQEFFDVEVIETSLQLASAVKLNEEELPTVAKMCGVSARNEARILRRLVHKYELRVAALTCGGEGALLMTPDEESRCPARPTTVVDTVGAGDAFTATMVIDFLRGVPLAAINRHANAVASFVCSQAGAVARLPADLASP